MFGLFVFIVLLQHSVVNAGSPQPEIYLRQGELIDHQKYRGFGKEDMTIYCYEGRPKYIIHLWQTVSMEIDLKSDDYVYYEGSTPQIVRKQYLEHRSSWRINLFSWKQKSFKLDPFNQSCIGIESSESYRVLLHVIRIDYWKVLYLLIGLVLFFSAHKLSKNVVFYYLCGITCGVCASFLILIYFVSKMFPRRPIMYATVLFSWSIVVYLLQMMFENTRTILLNYQIYVMWYIIITGVLSFIVCYRVGPVTNERTQNLIRWSLQGSGLMAVFFSSQFQEAAMGQIVMILLTYNFPKKWLSKSKTYWKRKFPPKVRLLSNAEYYQQGVRETAKALDSLRSHCSSPECNQWQTVLKLKDVKRFASFVEGTSHLSDNEILDYESSMHTTDVTDDEDELFTDEEL